MSQKSETLICIYTAPFAAYGVVHGFDLSLVDQQMAGFAAHADSGIAHQAVELSQRPSGDYSFVVRWQERREDALPGRSCRVTVKMGNSTGRANEVYLAGCYTNASKKRTGFGRQTRDAGAVYADSVDGALEVCADDDGRWVWLALEGQPHDDDHDSIVRKARRMDLSTRLVKRIRTRDYMGALRHHEDEFIAFMKTRPAWDGGWSRDQVRDIAGAAVLVNEGLR